MNTLLINVLTVAMQALATKDAQDELLDFVEELVARSPTTIDDRVLLPLIDAYRAVADIPDGDD